VRLHAIDAIRAIKSPASIPELIHHLDDSDPIVQHIAVMALWEIAQPPAEMQPAADEFDRNPQKYIQLWKRWWSDEQKKQVPRQ